MEVSVLDDVHFPTPDAKYWQSVREQSVHFSELIRLSFDYRRLLVDIQEIKHKLENPDLDLFERQRLEIDLEEKLFGEIEARKVGQDRQREVEQWQQIKDNLLPNLKFGIEDVNDHQLISYTQRWIQQMIAMGNNGSPPERWNLLGQLDKGIKMCVQKGVIDKVLQGFDPQTQEWIKTNILNQSQVNQK